MLGTFSKRILLTGAGWSRNWGGQLATEVWESLVGHAAIRGNPRLRDLLLRERLQLVPRQRELLLDLAENREVPGRQVKRRVRPDSQDVEARQQIEAALAVGVRDARVLSHAGEIALELGDRAAAERYLQDSAALNGPASEQARLTLAALMPQSQK